MTRDIDWEIEAYQEAQAFVSLNGLTSKPEDLVSFARQQVKKERGIIVKSIEQFTVILRRMNGTNGN